MPNPAQFPSMGNTNFNMNMAAPSWHGQYPWTPNFRFPTNPVTQAQGPHTTEATAEGIQQAMQKRSAQNNGVKRLSSAGEKSGVTYKHDTEGHLTGQSAFDTLDSYMKKAGLNTFQQQFFTRLIEQGMNREQIQQCVKRAGAEFGEKIAAELNSGFEKLAFPAAIPAALHAGRAALPWLARTAGRYIPAAARSVSGAVSRLLPSATRAAGNAAPAAASTTTRSGLGLGQLAQGAATGAFNPYTGINTWTDDEGNFDYGKALTSVGVGAVGSRLGGPALSKLTGRNVDLQQMQRRMMAGTGAGYGVGLGANALGYDVDPDTLARVGFAGAGALPNRAAKLVPSAVRKSLPRGVRRALATPLTNAKGTGPLDLMDPSNLAMKGLGAASQGASRASQAVLRNPGAFGGIGLGVGGLSLPFVANNAINSGLDRVTNQIRGDLYPLAEQALGTMENANTTMQDIRDRSSRMEQMFSDMTSSVKQRADRPFGEVQDYISNLSEKYPELAKALPYALLALAGAGGGGLLGGRTGATLGGIGLPLIYALMSGKNPLQGFMQGQGGQQMPESLRATAQPHFDMFRNMLPEGVQSAMADLPPQQQNELLRQQALIQNAAPVDAYQAFQHYQPPFADQAQQQGPVMNMDQMAGQAAGTGS